MTVRYECRVHGPDCYGCVSEITIHTDEEES